MAQATDSAEYNQTNMSDRTIRLLILLWNFVLLAGAIILTSAII